MGIPSISDILRKCGMVSAVTPKTSVGFNSRAADQEFPDLDIRADFDSVPGQPLHITYTVTGPEEQIERFKVKYRDHIRPLESP